MVAKQDIIKGHEVNCNFQKIKCKYFEEGCTFQAKKEVMRGHEVNDCRFRKIECPMRTCTELVGCQSVIDHVKAKHAAYLLPAMSNGPGPRTLGTVSMSKDIIGIFHFEGYSFLLLHFIENNLF